MASKTRVNYHIATARRYLNDARVTIKYLGTGPTPITEITRLRNADLYAKDAMAEAQQVRYDLRRIAKAKGVLRELDWGDPDDPN